MANSVSQEVHLHNRMHRAFIAQPVTYGVPWPEGAVKDVRQLVLKDETGEELPAGFKNLNSWPDGSVQWSLVDFMLDFRPSGDRCVSVGTGKSAAPAPCHPVRVDLNGEAATLSNGLVEIVVSGKRGELLKSWTTGGRDLVVADGFDVTFEDSGGKRFSIRKSDKRLTIERENAMRTVLRIDGKHAADDGDEMLDYFLRFEITADRADVKITHSFCNRELPVPGIEIYDFKATFQAAVGPDARRCFTANTLTRRYLTTCLRVDENPDIVASHTGDFDNYAPTIGGRKNGECFIRNPEVLHDPPENKPWYLQDPKYRLLAGGEKCVWPYLALLGEQGGVVGAFEKMAEMHPKNLSVDGSTLRFDLWPQWAGPLQVTQGAGRSHRIHLAPVPADASDVDMQNLYLSWETSGGRAIAITPDLDHVRRCKVLGLDMLPAYEPEERYLFERKVRDAWIGISYGSLGSVDQVSLPPAIGFWDYGDTGANNEEMHARVYFENYFRTGDWQCAEYGLAFADHIMEVDICSFSIDRLQNGGMVSHCLHHNDGTAYPSHMWFTELLFAYVLTGDEEYKNTAMGACEALLRWIDDEGGFESLIRDQREAGQPMINLATCYHFNRDQRYLDGCRKIIREGLMARAERFGRMLDPNPKPFNMPVKLYIYGDYATYEGMFWYWSITHDEEVKQFMLSQLDWRLTLPYIHVHGGHRCTDYNPAAYAYYMTGDKSWMERVARPFRAAFSAARWPLGWIHSMYCIKLALDMNIVSDDDILVQ